MLPIELRGPEKTIHLSDPEPFIQTALSKFPHLDREFVTQICYEHPSRFNQILPKFDASLHTAIRATRTVKWILENVTYDHSKSIHNEWAWHVDKYLERGVGGSEVLPQMVASGIWPFPPVIVEANFAFSIGAPPYVGSPYYLIEGTHRVSYLARLFELKRVSAESSLPIIEVMRQA